DVGLGEIDTAAPVKGLVALPIAEKGRPASLDVRPSAIQVVSRRKVQDRNGVANVVPMHQIVGAQDGSSRGIMHIGGGVVIRVADPENIAVGEVLPENGVLKLSALRSVGLGGAPVKRSRQQEAGQHRLRHRTTEMGNA